MDLERVAGHRTIGSRGRAQALVLAATLAALITATAAPAQAHAPYGAKAWGNNSNGELGDGSQEGPEVCGSERLACSTTPVPVSALSDVISMAGGRRFSLALLQDGTVMSWGENANGQLGDGTRTERYSPTSVKNLTNVKGVAAGSEYGLALLTDGTVMAWGANFQGQLGNGTNARSTIPVAVCAPAPEPCPGSRLSGVKAIAAGETHSLALLEDGSVVAWGNNADGELGDGSNNGSTVPVPVADLGAVQAIAAGEGYSLALLASDGTVMAWGKNKDGNLGNGTETSSNLPVAVTGLAGATAISAGSRHALALLQNGTVMAWGFNASGQLGDGTSEGPEQCGEPIPFYGCAKKPVSVLSLANVSAISAGNEDSLALLSSGSAMTWGKNEQGQLGDGLSTGPEACGIEGACSTTPVSSCAEGAQKVLCSSNGPFLTGAVGIAAGWDHSLAFGPPPTVTFITPKKGPASGGTYLGILGTYFSGATEVNFGSTPAQSFIVRSAALIDAVAPALPAGKVDIRVTNQWGVSAASTVDQFKVYPTVTSVSPNNGPPSGGTSVIIKGSGFATGKTATRVRFGKVRATAVECTSTTECTVISPTHEAGTVDVRVVVNKIGSPRNRPADQFTYS
jgi:alpha-tubulin suppressor-like RCC1 family protein